MTDHEIGTYASANIVDESGNIIVRCDSRLSGVVVNPESSMHRLQLQFGRHGFAREGTSWTCILKTSVSTTVGNGLVPLRSSRCSLISTHP